MTAVTCLHIDALLLAHIPETEKKTKRKKDRKRLRATLKFAVCPSLTVSVCSKGQQKCRRRPSCVSTSGPMQLHEIFCLKRLSYAKLLFFSNQMLYCAKVHFISMQLRIGINCALFTEIARLGISDWPRQNRISSFKRRCFSGAP